MFGIDTESFYIALGSMTQALRAEKALKDKKIECTVAKSASHYDKGCVWGVWVKGVRREVAINTLRLQSIVIL